jgi:hypothetical protein
MGLIHRGVLVLEERPGRSIVMKVVPEPTGVSTLNVKPNGSLDNGITLTSAADTLSPETWAYF